MANMETRVSSVELNMLLDSKEAQVYPGQPHSVVLGMRQLRETVYEVDPLRGLTFEVPADEFDGIIISRFGIRMNREDRKLLWQLMNGLEADNSLLESGVQLFPFNVADLGVPTPEVQPILLCVLDKEGMIGTPSMSWHVISGGARPYYEGDKRRIING